VAICHLFCSLLKWIWSFSAGRLNQNTIWYDFYDYEWLAHLARGQVSFCHG
jgi:hypothetical protein